MLPVAMGTVAHKFFFYISTSATVFVMSYSNRETLIFHPTSFFALVDVLKAILGSNPQNQILK